MFYITFHGWMLKCNRVHLSEYTSDMLGAFILRCTWHEANIWHEGDITGAFIKIYFTWGWTHIRWISHHLIYKVHWSTSGHILYICNMYLYIMKLDCDYYICPTRRPVRRYWKSKVNMIILGKENSFVIWELSTRKGQQLFCVWVHPRLVYYNQLADCQYTLLVAWSQGFNSEADHGYMLPGLMGFWSLKANLSLYYELNRKWVNDFTKVKSVDLQIHRKLNLSGLVWICGFEVNNITKFKCVHVTEMFPVLNNLDHSGSYYSTRSRTYQSGVVLGKSGNAQNSLWEEKSLIGYDLKYTTTFQNMQKSNFL